MMTNARRVVGNTTTANGDALAEAVLEVVARIARSIGAPAVGEPSYVHSGDYERLVEEPYRARRRSGA